MQLSLNEDYIHEWMPYHLYQNWLHADKGATLRFIYAESWPVGSSLNLDKGVKALGGELVAQISKKSGAGTSLVKLPSGALVTLRDFRGSSVLLDVAAFTKEEIAQVVRTVKTALPQLKVLRDNKPRILVNFMTVKHYNARTLDAARWREVAGNYPRVVRDQLQDFMLPEFRPTASGQLFLWHGLPGTGKTWALRALGYEWRRWADMVYIVDPDMFFGDSVYMMNTLMAGAQPGPYDPDDDDDNEENDEEKRVPSKDRWRLLVAEDTGELLAADAKQRTGQGLSRLLNIVDGMIGQGLRIMVLITTNEKLGALHPAVTRPGRAAGIVEFEAFPADEANEWLTNHNREPRKNVKPITLAELYNEKEKAPERKVGFAA